MPKVVYPRHQEKTPRSLPKHIDTLKSRKRRSDPRSGGNPTSKSLPRPNKSGKKPPKEARQVQMLRAQMMTGRKVTPLMGRALGTSTLSKSLQTNTLNRKETGVRSRNRVGGAGKTRSDIRRNTIRASGKGKNPKGG